MEEAKEEGLINISNSKLDKQSCIVKGKRTKRQRPQYDDTNYVSPSSEEEDEEMANCLIMLAEQCESRETIKPADHYEYGHHSSKFNSSRRFLQDPVASGTAKVGYYVYECRTCNRTFASFQALGGHRASHNRRYNKAVVNYEISEEEDGNFRNVSSLSLQLIMSDHNNNSNLYSRSSRIHECSICGAEFTSGQALGGHMRRHRAAPVATTTTARASNMLPLDLDLNLPAPEDDVRESKLPFTSKQQQQKSSLVFSAGTTLVNCHY